MLHGSEMFCCEDFPKQPDSKIGNVTGALWEAKVNMSQAPVAAPLAPLTEAPDEAERYVLCF